VLRKGDVVKRTFLPSVHGSDKTQAFVDAWLQRLGARANLMRPDVRLMRAAGLHAEFLASLGDDLDGSAHFAGGSSPNARVRAQGYRLPDFYPNDNNNCESWARNWEGPDNAVERLFLSEWHRPMMAGERVNDWFWEPQVVYGVGQAGNDYIVLACPPEAG
jgi:hypothetical protein